MKNCPKNLDRVDTITKISKNEDSTQISIESSKKINEQAKKNKNTNTVEEIAQAQHEARERWKHGGSNTTKEKKLNTNIQNIEKSESIDDRNTIKSEIIPKYITTTSDANNSDKAITAPIVAQTLQYNIKPNINNDKNTIAKGTPSQVLMSGFLFKRTTGFWKQWSRRYFELIATGQIVYYHKKPIHGGITNTIDADTYTNDTKKKDLVKRVIVLTAESFSRIATPEEACYLHRPYVFIVRGYYKTSIRIYLLCSYDTIERERWVHAINDVIRSVFLLNPLNPLLYDDTCLSRSLREGRLYMLDQKSRMWLPKYVVLSALYVCIFTKNDDQLPHTVFRLSPYATCNPEVDDTNSGLYVFSLCPKSILSSNIDRNYNDDHDFSLNNTVGKGEYGGLRKFFSRHSHGMYFLF